MKADGGDLHSFKEEWAFYFKISTEWDKKKFPSTFLVSWQNYTNLLKRMRDSIFKTLPYNLFHVRTAILSRYDFKAAVLRLSVFFLNPGVRPQHPERHQANWQEFWAVTPFKTNKKILSAICTEISHRFVTTVSFTCLWDWGGKTCATSNSNRAAAFFWS